MIPEVISDLYCPQCSGQVEFDPSTMINDNGWIIVYDMLLARSISSQKLSDIAITPGLLFDQGYATWKEIYPGELKDSQEEKARLVEMAKSDSKKYFIEIKKWANARMERLKREGWRKAQAL